ncbi:MAG: cytochrome b6-f complex iron-sulfur subunit, partial [Synechococcaceae cyanobacterium SM2_3_2]|nr:cytochrome b6-f complex iron-sulfur subunit [Synechococcaceae cyanobacterium SM2_3_2]
MTDAAGKFEAPSMSRRLMMSTLLGDPLALLHWGTLPCCSFFIPPSSGTGDKGVVAKD